MIDATPVSSRPKMVFESSPGAAVTWASGPSCKAYVTRCTKRDYAITMRLVSAVQLGGAVAQTPGDSHGLWGGSTNLKSPHASRSPCLERGRYGGPTNAPDARMEPLPDHVGAWIRLGWSPCRTMLVLGFVRSVARGACSRKNWHVVLASLSPSIAAHESSAGPLHFSVNSRQQ
jgi:hypothetical protein